MFSTAPAGSYPHQSPFQLTSCAASKTSYRHQVAVFPRYCAPQEDQSGSAADWRSPKSDDQEDDGRPGYPERSGRPRDRAVWTMVLRNDHLRSAPVVVDVGYTPCRPHSLLAPRLGASSMACCLSDDARTRLMGRIERTAACFLMTDRGRLRDAFTLLSDRSRTSREIQNGFLRGLHLTDSLLPMRAVDVAALPCPGGHVAHVASQIDHGVVFLFVRPTFFVLAWSLCRWCQIKAVTDCRFSSSPRPSAGVDASPCLPGETTRFQSTQRWGYQSLRCFLPSLGSTATVPRSASGPHHMVRTPQARVSRASGMVCSTVEHDIHSRRCFCVCFCVVLFI